MKNFRVHFKVVDGKIIVKNLKVTPEEYEKIANTIHGLVGGGILENRDFNASINLQF